MTTKLIVLGFAGVKILTTKAVLAMILLVGALIDITPLYSKANLEYVDLSKSPYGLCGNGIAEYGELCDGKVNCDIPCMCAENFTRC
ncbi:MAG: hypothetical protein H6765_02155 [Candidatus Peribacteria bacterium]|nr:MAG: hypothetical protein H6765_02155 [Candidatus Peribacteria bacterium]